MHKKKICIYSEFINTLRSSSRNSSELKIEQNQFSNHLKKVCMQHVEKTEHLQAGPSILTYLACDSCKLYIYIGLPHILCIKSDQTFRHFKISCMGLQGAIIQYHRVILFLFKGGGREAVILFQTKNFLQTTLSLELLNTINMTVLMKNSSHHEHIIQNGEEMLGDFFSAQLTNGF